MPRGPLRTPLRDGQVRTNHHGASASEPTFDPRVPAGAQPRWRARPTWETCDLVLAARVERRAGTGVRGWSCGPWEARTSSPAPLTPTRPWHAAWCPAARATERQSVEVGTRV